MFDFNNFFKNLKLNYSELFIQFHIYIYILISISITNIYSLILTILN